MKTISKNYKNKDHEDERQKTRTLGKRTQQKTMCSQFTRHTNICIKHDPSKPATTTAMREK